MKTQINQNVPGLLKLMCLTFIILIHTGCNEDEVLSINETLPRTVSGTIQNNKDTDFPEDLNVAIIWVTEEVDGSSIYLLGAGDINSEDMTFSIEINEILPDEALKANQFGIGFVCLLRNEDINKGYIQDELFDTVIHGFSPQHVVIYTNEKTSNGTFRDWPKDFPKGYTVGEGSDETDGGFFIFKPTTDDRIEVIYDDLENINVLEWT